MLSFIQSWQNAKISMDRLNEVHGMEDEEPSGSFLLQEMPVTFSKQLVGGKMVTLNQYQGFTTSDKDSNIIGFNPSENFHMEPEGLILSNFSFTYPGAGNEPVLKNLNLRIPKGHTTAIVGVSGSGKTSLLKLLLKFYTPQKGEIRLGKTLLSSISHKVWRANCGSVMQESFIFSDTIAKNIAVGEDKIDMVRLEYSIKVANISDYIDGLPLGLNTKIGAEGISVSMGQKQRLLIARAVYREPEFIFLDEATNSLDANNESLIVQNLGSFLKGKTVVIVSHRLSTVKHADQIVVLDKGQIIEIGTHQELVNLKGGYFTLVRNQLELVD
jgi:ATP-binding cassette subfamily B protein